MDELKEKIKWCIISLSVNGGETENLELTMVELKTLADLVDNA